jgi:Glycosyl hydrolases family 43
MKLKLVFIYCSLLMLLAACNSKAYLFTSFHEPANEGLRMLYSYDGYKWKDFDTTFLKPEVGLQKVLRDPSMVQDNNGNFHLVWTSSWRGDLGFGYATSKDLVHWSNQQFFPVMQSEPTTVNVWAPELVFSDIDNNCKIIWASCIPGRYEKGIEADSNNYRMYITSTNDFESFDQTKLFFNPGYSVIDATIVKIKDNEYVMVFKDNTRPERNLKVAFANNPLGPWENISKPFTEKFTEGPTVVKVKNGWLIYYDAYQNKKYGARFTKDFKSFTNADSLICVPLNHKHGTIVTVKKKFIKQLKLGLKNR